MTLKITRTRRLYIHIPEETPGLLRRLPRDCGREQHVLAVVRGYGIQQILALRDGHDPRNRRAG
jgi:hypothetical protein